MSEDNNLTIDPEIDTPSEPQPEPQPEPIVFDDDNILHTVKAALGLDIAYHPFDTEIVMDINTVLGIVNQLGVGVDGYKITKNGDAYEGSWSEFLANESADNVSFEEVKTYVSERVRLLFDPPGSGILMEAKNKIISELEWRIVVKKDTP